ncbi:MAG: hypothetical protein LBV34_24765, partial [Nocardiopsaceae bacterium]|nr:hypothetical protein [Nocardiopsaceae bacterium]
LAGLARMSVLGSAAPAEVKSGLIAKIDAWLAAPDPASGIPRLQLDPDQHGLVREFDPEL